jgi:hypothetical protein
MLIGAANKLKKIWKVTSFSTVTKIIKLTKGRQLYGGS